MCNHGGDCKGMRRHDRSTSFPRPLRRQLTEGFSKDPQAHLCLRSKRQKSFKECLLDNRERAQLVGELKAVMVEKTDRIHFFELDPRRLAAAVGKVRRSSIDPFLIL